MPISWDHPAAIELRKEVVDGMVDTLSIEDFLKARTALEKADLNFRNTYAYTPEGDFYMSQGKPIPVDQLHLYEKI